MMEGNVNQQFVIHIVILSCDLVKIIFYDIVKHAIKDIFQLLINGTIRDPETIRLNQ